MQKAQTPTVLAFGTFDGLHHGHLFFLSEAKKLGDLHVSVSSNESAAQRKGRQPKHSVNERVDAVKALGIASWVKGGDTTLNNWTAVKEVRPDIIAVGYDQFGLKTVLADIQAEYRFEIKVIGKKDEEI